MARTACHWLAGPVVALVVSTLSACGGAGSTWTQESTAGNGPATTAPAEDTSCTGATPCTAALDGPEDVDVTGGRVAPPPGWNGGNSGGEPVGQKSAAITTSVQTAMSRSGHELAETNAAAFENSSGQWEMVVGSNDDYPTSYVSEDTSHFDYGCARDSYSTWCQYTLSSSLGLFGPDDTLTYRAGSTHYLYMLKMRSDTAGFRVMRSTDPCPSSCGSPSWSICNISFSGVDFPTIRWTNSSDTIYFTFVKSGHLWVGRVNEPWCSSWSYWEDSYATGVGGARATFDNSGKMHILFTRPGASAVYHTVFDPSSGFSSTVTFVSDAYLPGNRCDQSGWACTTDGRPTYYNLGTTKCLRYGPDLGIDYDPWTGTLIATTTSQGSGSCNQKQEERIFRSTDGGSSWSYRLVTGCNTSIFTAPRSASIRGYVGTAGYWQVRSSYNSGTGLREVMWRSTDDGQSWAGSYITGTRNVGGPIHHDCYWGDYNGLAADPANSSFFYSFGNGTYTSDWVIRAKAQND